MKKLQKRENALRTVEQFYVPCDCYCSCTCSSGDATVKSKNYTSSQSNDRASVKSILNS